MNKIKWGCLILSTLLSFSVHAKQCVKSGCSSQLCVDASLGAVHSTCEYKESYYCLKKSICEEQKNGECGWTHTPAYTSCMAELEENTTPF